MNLQDLIEDLSKLEPRQKTAVVLFLIMLSDGEKNEVENLYYDEIISKMDFTQNDLSELNEFFAKYNISLSGNKILSSLVLAFAIEQLATNEISELKKAFNLFEKMAYKDENISDEEKTILEFISYRWKIK